MRKTTKKAIRDTLFNASTALTLSLVAFAGGVLGQGFSITENDEFVEGDRGLVPLSHFHDKDDSEPIDPILARASIDVSVDEVAAEKLLNVSVTSGATTFRPGQAVNFVTYCNYQGYVTRGEVLIYDLNQPRGSAPIATLPMDCNETSAAVSLGEGSGEYAYVYRVYDRYGRFDETHSLPLTQSTGEEYTQLPVRDVIAPAEAETRLARSTIHVEGAAVTVAIGDLAPRSNVMVDGRLVPVDANGRAIYQTIVPPGDKTVQVVVDGRVYERRVDVPDADWIYVGLLDFTVYRSNRETETFGRAAGYAKGRLSNGVVVTISADTREAEIDDLFNGALDQTPEGYLARLNVTDGYTVFGDDSTIFEDAPTSGKLYLRVEDGRSYVIWGNYEVDNNASYYVKSKRSLYGAKAHYESPEVTSRGEPRVQITDYAANAFEVPQTDVLLGTGGSSYFLHYQDIRPGSEVISVEIRDHNGRVVERRDLVNGEDYEIDYSQGFVILSSPLTGQADDGFITGSPDTQRQQYLVVDYEHRPGIGDVEGLVAGGDADRWVTDQLRIGASAKLDQTDEADYSILSLDGEYRFTPKSFVRAEYARSEGRYFGENLSIDGGLSFRTQGLIGGTNVDGEAVRIDLHADLVELGMGVRAGYVEAYHETLSEGFLSGNSFTANDTARFGASADVDVNDDFSVRAAVDNESVKDLSKETVAKLDAIYRYGDQWEFTIGLGHIEYDDLVDNAEDGSRTDVAVKAEYHHSDNLSLYGFGQASIANEGRYDEYWRVGVGAKARITDRISATGEIFASTYGEGGEIMLRYEESATDYYYAGYRVDPERELHGNRYGLGENGEFVSGFHRQFNDRVSGFAEVSHDLFGDRRGLTQTYGINYNPGPNWSYTGLVEFGELTGVAEAVSRKAISIGGRYQSEVGHSGHFRLEYRVDDYEDPTRTDTETLALNGGYEYQRDENWRLIARADALYTLSDGASLANGQYLEASLGAAYRPIDNDKFNALFQLGYTYNAPGINQRDAYDQEITVKHRALVVSTDGNYDVNENLTIGAKLGYRTAETAPIDTNDWTDASAMLWVLRADYGINYLFDITGEIRQMQEFGGKTSQVSGLLAGYYHINENFKIGVGYDFGKFTDSLYDFEEHRAGVFINAIAKF